MHHEELGSLKVGVASTSSRYDRVDAHQKNGWNLIKSWKISSGRNAEDLEKLVLKYWRDELSKPIHLDSYQIPQGGWTETVLFSEDLKNSTIILVESKIIDFGNHHQIAEM
jgi:hypothetical protein